jgi:predicted O-methyltransferase YrrM
MSPLEASYPWMPYEAIFFLESILKPDFRILEFGSGGSTIFLLKRATHVTTIEHECKWLEKTKSFVNKNKLQSKWNYYIVNYFENEETNISDHYLKPLEQLSQYNYDLIIVDGRYRVNCIKHTFNLVKPGGYLLLDNSERKDYNSGISFLDEKGWKKRVFNGTCFAFQWDSSSTIWKNS